MPRGSLARTLNQISIIFSKWPSRDIRVKPRLTAMKLETQQYSSIITNIATATVNVM